MYILCNIGPACKEFFEEISASIDKESKIKLISSFEKLDQTKSIKKYRFLVKKKYKIIDNFENFQTIKRCRLLRELKYKEALKHVCITRTIIKELIQEEKFDLILSESIDQFFSDILFQEAKKQKIKCFGIIRTPLNGYFRITNYGERFYLREPKDNEIQSIVDKLTTKNYIPKCIQKEKGKPKFSYLKKFFLNYIRTIYYFICLYFLNKRYIYFYWVSFIGSIKSLHVLPVLKLGKKNWKRLLDPKKDLIFVPLQVFPESTIDYWSEDLEMVNYEENLINFLKKLSSDFQIILKEHPWALGYRNPNFYKKIKNVSKNIIFVPTNTASSECIETANLILVWTGTAGFEAALRGKPVLTTCNPYYVSGKNFRKINLDTSLEEIKEFTKDKYFEKFSEKDKYDLVKNLLRYVAPGKCLIYDDFNKNKKEDLEQAKIIASYIFKLFKKDNYYI